MTLLNIYIYSAVRVSLCVCVCVCKRAFTAPWGMEIGVELFWNFLTFFLTFEGAFDETLKFLKKKNVSQNTNRQILIAIFAKSANKPVIERKEEKE